MIRNLAWRVVSRIVTFPAVTNWLIARAKRTPYKHITARHDPSDVYMGRWWLFNPYPPEDGEDNRSRLRKRLPSVRIHHIMRPDDAGPLHDHPWNARTILLRGWYTEELPSTTFLSGAESRNYRVRSRGYTGRLLFGQYHRISTVPDEGVWTLFITWRKQGTWGFLVDGVKVPWRDYLKSKQP